MIYLITGEPGDGKTNEAITVVKARAEAEKRPVFFAGVTILDPVALPWVEIDPAEWFNCPVGAIVLIDEAQTTFEPRQRGKPQPQFARELETHRHAGIDLYLVTQHPTLLDAHDRKLVGTHCYIRRKMGTRWKTVFTFKGCADYPEKMRSRALDTRETTDNKAAFDWYKSTELNTTRRQIPKKLWVLLFCLVAVPGLLGWVAWRVSERRSAHAAANSAVKAPAGAGAPGAAFAPGGGGRGGTVVSPADYAAAQIPRIPGLAFTAPVFDGVTAPVVAPYPAACVQSPSKCVCYTQQATVLETPGELCAAIVRKGFFVAWKVEDSRPASGQRIGGGSDVLVGGAKPPGLSGVQPLTADLRVIRAGGDEPRRSLVNGRSAPGLSSEASPGAGVAGP